MSNLTMLQQSGMEGTIMVVLCGPFTTTQKALVLQKTAVNQDKVVCAWQWLKANNFRYKDCNIPDRSQIPLPYVVDEKM